MSPTLTLTLASRRTEIDRLITSMEAFGADAGLSEDVMFRLTLVLDEVVSNVMRHAHRDAEDHQILVRVSVNDGLITAVVEDDGHPFDPLTVPPPNINAIIEERPIGGLGLHIVRSLTESIAYRRDPDRNVLTVIVGPR